jgi:hypothetical protein
MIANLRDNNLIKVQLGKHVVNRRSIVFLVDTSYEGGDFYMKAANKFMLHTYQELDPHDYFGYICIGNDDCMFDKNSNEKDYWPCSKLRLEKKETNTKAKASFLEEIV